MHSAKRLIFNQMNIHYIKPSYIQGYVSSVKGYHEICSSHPYTRKLNNNQIFVRKVIPPRNLLQTWEQVGTVTTIQKSYFSSTTALKKLRLEDSWSNVHSVSKDSIKVLQGHINGRFLGVASIFLQIADTISFSENQEATIKEILEDDTSRCHYPFAGPLSSAYYSWMTITNEMERNKELDNIDLINPGTQKELALTNLTLLVRKVMFEVHQIDISNSYSK